MRFDGQGFEILVNMPAGRLGPSSASAMRDAFHAEYKKIYDAVPGDFPIEALTWRLRAAGPACAIGTLHPVVPPVAAARPPRAVYFPEVGATLQAVVVDRYAMQPGDHVTGPAVIEERESTVIVGPRGSATIDADLHLIITITQPSSMAGDLA